MILIIIITLMQREKVNLKIKIRAYLKTLRSLWRRRKMLNNN